MVGPSPQPLSGIRILEWAEWVQAPMAVSLLGDLGAEVIKIEPPGRGDALRGATRMWGFSTELPGGSTLGFEASNRNKKSIVLDLYQTQGREVVYRLVPRCDAFVRGYRQPAAEKLGMDYPTLRQHNPRLIYATASGFGPEGEKRDLPAFDWVAHAYSGLLHRIAEDMQYVNLIEGVSDVAGSMTLAYGILAALLARERLGIGQEIHTSLLGSTLHLLRWPLLSFTLYSGQQPPKQGREANPNPLVNVYRCGDGRWIVLCLYQSQRYWAQLCRTLGLEGLINDPRFADGHQRRLNSRELIAILDRVFASRPSEEWCRFLARGDIVSSPVQTLDEVAADPQAWGNRYFIEAEHPLLGTLKQGGFPVSFSGTPCPLPQPAPQFGQHTEEVLLEVGGYSWEEIGRLREQGVI